MTTLWLNTGTQKETESLQEKSTLPKKLLTIEIMHKRHSNYTVYFSFKMLNLQLNIPSEWIYVGSSKVRQVTVKLMICIVWHDSYCMESTTQKLAHSNK